VSRPLRVLHCPALVGGQAEGLARAERELGLDSRTIVLQPPPFGYEADEVVFVPGSGRAGRELRRWRTLLRALRDFDVVHFNFGSTLMPRYYPPSMTGGHGPAARRLFGLYARLVEDRDLAWLRRRGLGVFVTYQGDDARQSSERSDAALGTDYFDAGHDRRKRDSIARFERHAHGIYALNPDLLAVLPARARFLPYASVDLRAWRPVDGAPGEVPLVVHAPSDRHVKGTRFVLEAIDRLQDDGVQVELVLVEGLERDEARRLYERADLVVDQLLTGWYGGVAVEAMALGKPVVAHIDERDLARIPAEMAAELPILRATPESLVEVLRDALTRRRDDLPALGRAGRAFAERWHDPLGVAAELKGAYERSVPSYHRRP
jgi:glycosyltransferase involved in cell wall biosynthesis